MISDPFPSARKQPTEREQTDPRLAAVADALEQLDEAKSVPETIDLCCATIMGHFSIGKLAVALLDEGAGCYRVTGICGVAEELGSLPVDAAGAFVARNKTKRTLSYDARMRAALPALEATRCCSLPLHSHEQLMGFFLIVDPELSKGDLMLLSMVAHAAAARLTAIFRDAEESKVRSLSDRVMTLANSLLLVDNKEDLYQSILSLACDLVEATQGCIMLADDTRETFKPAFSRGISPDLAHTFAGNIGQGTADKVAEAGEPLLVNDSDEEHQSATSAASNLKPRSLLCIPLKMKEKVIGVLHLSEKKGRAAFTNADLQVLTSFAKLASLMIERTHVLEKSMRFEQLSVTDSLTGLYNRRFLKSRLEEELNRSTHQELQLTVLFIDLDHFKSYNDVCGHLAGDQALKKTADIIKGSVREMDIVARYGGEEFCAVLPGTSKTEALLVAERIRSEIEGERFPGENDLSFKRITASIGVASFPEDGETFTALVHASDVALYQAKASGRNRIVAAQTPACQFPSPGTEDDSNPGTEIYPIAESLEFGSYQEAGLATKH